MLVKWTLISESITNKFWEDTAGSFLEKIECDISGVYCVIGAMCGAHCLPWHDKEYQCCHCCKLMISHTQLLNWRTIGNSVMELYLEFIYQCRRCTKLVRANWALTSPGSSMSWLAAHMIIWTLYLTNTRRDTEAPLRTPSRANLVETRRQLCSSWVSSTVCYNYQILIYSK